MNDCLLVMDIQNGYITDETRHIVKPVSDLIDSGKFRYVAASQAINITRAIMGNESSEGKKAIDFPDGMPTDRFDIIIHKNDIAELTAGFAKFARAKGISRVYLAGIDAGNCLMAVTINLLGNKICPYVLENYCASIDGSGSYQAGIRALKAILGEKGVIRGCLR